MKNYITLFFLVLLSTASLCQTREVIIDLSKNSGDVINESISSHGNIRVEVINRNPNKKYTFTFNKQIREVVLPKLPSLGSISFKNSNCNIKNLLEGAISKDETDIPKLIEELESEIESGNCDGSGVDEVRKFLNNTKFVKEISISSGEDLEVQISRELANQVTKKWETKFSTPSKGKWVTSYGFSFIHLYLSKEKKYFSQSGDSSNFIIKEKNSSDDVRYAPSILFSWMPTKKLNKTWAFSLTAGLGVETESPVVFLGFSAFYNQFIGITGGLAAHKKEFLSGMYQPDQSIAISLSDEQLHEEKYAVNAFLSISFRFSDSPFKPKDSTEIDE